jgi:hypothetical protein
VLHKIELTDAISQFPEVQFAGRVYRVTGQNSDPTAPTGNGGRWALPTASDGGCSVLYTCLDPEGAIAEVVSYLKVLTPMPKKPLHRHTLEISTHRTLKFAMADLEKLGVKTDEYYHQNYTKTQEIGAAMHFLGLDGLIVPSARWKCENLVVFSENHALSEKLEKVAVEKIDWQEWARKNGVLN